MPARMTITELARRGGVPTSTLRYYERRGLLRPDARSGGNYRLYERDALHRLRFIRAAQASGFALDDIRALLELRHGETDPCAEVQTLIEQRLTGVERKLADLRHVRKELRSALDRCRGGAQAGRCRVIDRLEEKSDATA